MADKNKDGAEEEVAAYSDEAVAEYLRERQERIAIRKARIGETIARKNEALKEGSVASSLEFLSVMGDDGKSGAGGSTVGGPVPESKAKMKEARESRRSGGDPLDIQIDESRKQLEQIILDGENVITNVRIAAECRENVRHIRQSESRRERLDRLRKESEECQTMYDDLKPNFNLSKDKKLPTDLFDAVKNQMQSCEELLMKKQDLIQNLQQELEENDFEYEQNLEMYQKDVSLMGDRIDDCVDEMITAFLNELGLIEDYTCRNREVLLEENQREWMDLLEDFQTMEENNLEQRKKDALNKFQALNELYVNVKQECRANRHKFEDDLRMLIQELEQIKYATQLNMEKLQYNLTIIRKRYKENVEMKNMMKRLLLKFNDRFTTKSRGLKQKMEAGRKEAKRILADIAKLEESLDHFGRKTLHLAVSDWNKYMDLWVVSEEMVRDRVQRLVESEKYIFETQLGIESPLPDLSYLDERPEVVTKYIVKKRAAYAALANSGKPTTAEEVKSKKSTATSLGDDTDAALRNAKPLPCKTNPSLILLPSESVEFVPGPEPDPEIQRRLMKHVAKVICDESGFLVEEELRRLVEPLMETERNLINLDALLKALGINSVGEMQYLAHFLLRRCRVTKGIISRMGSQASAHLSEMNVSLTGIVGKNAAMDDFDSQSAGSYRTGSVSGAAGAIDGHTSDEGANGPEFKECHCDGVGEGSKPTTTGQETGDDDKSKPQQTTTAQDTTDKSKSTATGAGKRSMGETSVDVVHLTSTDDDVDDTMCLILPELKGMDDQQMLTMAEYTHQYTQCTPKCCSVESLGGEEEDEDNTLAAAVRIIDEDGELEDVLEKSAAPTRRVTKEKSATFTSERELSPSVSFAASEGDFNDEFDRSTEGESVMVDTLSEGNRTALEEEEEERAVVSAKCSTCGGEPHDHQDCSFRSDAATVFSWVDPQDPPNQARREEMKKAKEVEDEGKEEVAQPLESRVTITQQLTQQQQQQQLIPVASLVSKQTIQSTSVGGGSGGDIQQSVPQKPGSDIGQLDMLSSRQSGKQNIEVLKEPVRVFSEIQDGIGGAEPTSDKEEVELVVEHEWQADDEEESADTRSLVSEDSSSNGSEEFMYIGSDEVIEALTEFCKEYNAKITIELPTLDELIDRKLATFKYPRQTSVLEYWERSMRLLSVKSDDLWEGMQYSFEEFNASLKKRNSLVDEVADLYRKNYELSFLMRNHLSSATQRFLPTPTGSGTRASSQFC